MRVLLAPMEGVLDSLVRELLTEVNDYDLCITEFVRVVDQLLNGIPGGSNRLRKRRGAYIYGGGTAGKVVPVREVGRQHWNSIQEMHMLTVNCLCDLIDNTLFPHQDD